MKKIITAMGNEFLNNELKKYAKYDVLCEDAFCQDVALDCINKYEFDTFIVSGLLQGQWNIEEFIDRVRKRNNSVRIIIVTDEIEPSTRKILEEKNVLDIFLDSKVEIRDIIEAIDREESIKKKYEMLCDAEAKYEVKPQVASLENVIIEKAVQKQEVIAISGTSGSGKSTIAMNLCKVLFQKSDAKILIIDMDTLNGNLDEIAKVNKVPENVEMIIDEDKKSGINYASELIIKNRFDANVFDELVVDCGGFDLLTGNTSLYYCQNVLEEKCYEKILQCAKEKYDFIILDTSSNIFLDSTKWALQVANRILFVTESNYICVKKMQQLIGIIVSVWGIWKPKIEIVVNKKQKNSLETEVLSGIMEGTKVVGEIKLNEETNWMSYENILANINYIPKKSIMEKISELKKNIFMMPSKEAVLNAN